MNIKRPSVKNICNFNVSKSIFSFLFIAVFMAASVSALSDPSVSTDKADYSPSDTVIVTGAGFDAGAQLIVKVTRPDGLTFTGDGSLAVWPTPYDSVVADENGAFTYNYVLDGIVGVYNIEVFDVNNTVLATNTFTDASVSVDFKQCANKDLAGTCDWIGSILQASNSVYYEDMVVPQRIFYQTITSSGPHTVTFSYSYTKGGIHAYDFLATVIPTASNFVQGVTGQGYVPGITNLNTCGGFTKETLANCTALATTTPTLVNVPSDLFNSKDSVPAPGTGTSQKDKEISFETTHPISFSPYDPNKRYITVYNSTTAAFTGASVSLAHDVGENGDTGDSFTDVTLSFTSSGCTSSAPCSYLIFFGGHLALGGSDELTDSNWGPGLGSSNIKGGPYHIKTLKFDGSGGSLDNQIKGADILIPPSASLTVIKVVNGGTATPNQFNLHVKYQVNNSDVAGSPAAGSETGTTYTLSPNTYVVSENPLTGYLGTITGDCASDGSVTLVNGNSKTCTITNTLQTGTLLVIKHVVNDNGGSTAASAFSVHVKSGVNDVSGSPAAGSESGTSYTLNAGTYVVSEDAPPTGYAQTGFSNDCDSAGSVTVVAGETKTCTITNDDIAPLLTVIKEVHNDYGGTLDASDFLMSVTGVDVSSSSFSGSSVGTDVTLDAGAYSVNEAFVSGYAKSLSANCVGTIAIGEHKTCTITNQDIQPVLHVIKHVINDNGGSEDASAWTMAVTGESPLPASFSGDEAGTLVTLDAGTYSVSESGPGGYTESDSTDCSGTIAIGDDKTCTITNDDVAPTLTLVKTVVNDDGGKMEVKDFALFINGSAVTSGVAYEVGANVVHTASETSLTGYTASVWGGDCAADGTISMLPGDKKTCTITNDDIAPKLTLVKTVDNGNGGDKQVSDFNLYIDGVPATSGTAYEVMANQEITATEDELFGYEASVWGTDCADDGTITLLPGEEKTCTITNDDIQPKLIVIKHVINDNLGTKTAADFAITVTGNSPSPATFPGAESPGTDVLLNVGDYSVSEALDLGYGTTYSADCTGSIAIGETKTCTITNNDVATTRTLGFWQTHTAFTTTIFDGIKPITIGSKTIDTPAKLFGGFYSSISKKTDGTKRSSLDQARMQLLQQYLAAKLNCGAFVCNQATKDLLTAASNAYTTGPASLILSYASQLDAYNKGGDIYPFPSSLPPQGSATPQTSQSIADKVFWNAP